MIAAGAFVFTLLTLQGGFLRIGYSFGFGTPSMGDEKAFAEVLTDFGIDYNLDGASTRQGIELLTDASSAVRLRGGASITRFRGDHSQTTSYSNVFLAIFTLGLLGSSSSSERVIWLDNVSTDFEASAYYIMPGASWFSLGGGPVLTSVTRRFNTLNSTVRESKTDIGFHTGARLDQLSGRFLGLPIVFGAEVGYRFQKVKLDGSDTGDFSVDFSGPMVNFGTYLKL